MNLDELKDLLESLRTVPSEEAESFTELDHALQCAWNLHEATPEDEELILAGLVHDVGHDRGSDENHGVVGGDMVRPILGERVAALVTLHVPAKRYLVATDSAYAEVLSPVSTMSLRLQGGPAGGDGNEAWERSPHFHDALTLRRADDRAKTPGRVVPPLDRWLPLLDRQAGRQGAPAT